MGGAPGPSARRHSETKAVYMGMVLRLGGHFSRKNISDALLCGLNCCRRVNSGFRLCTYWEAGMKPLLRHVNPPEKNPGNLPAPLTLSYWDSGGWNGIQIWQTKATWNVAEKKTLHLLSILKRHQSTTGESNLFVAGSHSDAHDNFSTMEF
jgi:hypothetical protein